MAQGNLPKRIVHLQGGLRAIDDRSGTDSVEADESIRLLEFPTPNYPKLYLALQAIGFDVVGVNFVTSNTRESAPDWWLASPDGGFQLEAERRAWNEIRQQALNELELDIVDASRRSATLLQLLAIRLYQMSTAYNEALCVLLSRESTVSDHLFDNTFTSYIAAAVHAFAGDAATLRDTISEIVWHNVLREKEEVRSFRTFRKRARRHDHPLSIQMIAEGEGGWIEALSKLRNDILHAAPIGSQHTLPSCISYTVPVQGKSLTVMKYGILEHDPDLENALQRALVKKDGSSINQQAMLHWSKVKQSRDALNYAWITTDNLVKLLRDARRASGLTGATPTLNSEDIVR